ncbi:MAG: biotin--[acetyl-CoA-carboxylase] ligase [Lachnospiraceae bacterium]|nr:biotin--[acetyl-CoA-carboxylase] ligase [Lachnospiraceae bacterium]
MKEELLSLLRERNGYVSGQELCRHFGVSRTAVWKAVNRLKEAGYEIEAVPNKGYRILSCPDSVAAVEVSSLMETEVIGRDVRYMETIDSTNLYARRLGEDGAAEGVLVVADEQTAGKGRSGRHWTTPPGSAIAMSVLLRPRIAPERISMVTLVMGLAVAKAVRELYGLDALIKWPNDVVVNGKKICGILTEMSAELMAVNYIVIGVGINSNMKEFPEEIRTTATSVALELGQDISRSQLIAEVMKHFETLYRCFLETSDLSRIMSDYNAILVNTGRRVRVLEPGNEYSAQALGTDRLGRLLVRTDEGTVREVYAGEVSVRGIYGYV